MTRNDVGRFDLWFMKQYGARNHTLAATVIEMHSRAPFHDSGEFLRFVELSTRLDTDPRRFTVLAEKVVLDDRFGPYCARKQIEAEDRAPAYAGGESFLVLKVYGYVFVHPDVADLIVTVDYSERGPRHDLDPDFEAKARQFLEGFRLTKQ